MLSPFPRRKTLEGLVPPQAYCSELGGSEMGVRGGIKLPWVSALLREIPEPPTLRDVQEQRRDAT